MSKLIRTGIALAVLTFLPLSGYSQTSLFLGPHVGIHKAQDADGSNYLVGATARLRLIPLFGVEGDISYRQEKYGSDVVTVREWPVTITGLIYPLPVIYAGLGAGMYSTTFDYAEEFNDLGIDDETERNFGWHVAAGIEVPASPRISLFGDLRYVWLDYKFKDLPGAVLDGVDPDFYSINLGILFRI